ncbi:methyl-accepting chemotaxis protein [Paenibacillus agricola]|uniref:HAMP domain-containing protein n=1 Tax=Paenibacillus agricola TaxID=2716264 RepID=A0ABX0JA15_9BACL|nr:methyl-accepting chemotaxis protein [Paenibacillus agricola]NHN32230.1 HAMP domain-containing protein [Paenibacillus agricola]
MLDKMLSPFTSIISRLKYGQKFMLISVLFMIPVVILLYIWTSTQQVEIKLIKSEQVGVEQVSEMMPFMLQVQQHRGLVNGYLNGNREAKAQIEAKQQELTQSIEQVETNFQKKSLPQSYEKWVSAKREWDVIHSAYESLKASDSFDRHSNLVKQVEELIVSGADESGLSLDSEINSYYMMKLIVQELPALIESSAIIRGRGNGVLASRTLTDEIKTQLLLESSKSKAALANLNKSLAKIAEFNSSINGELLKKVEQAAQNIQNYLGLLDQEILNKQGMSMNPDTFFAEGTAAIATAAEVFQLATTELDHTLQERINDSTATRNITLLITAAVLILVAIFYVAFYKSVMETVSALKQRAEAMAKGDFSQDIVLNTKDELQLVGIAFNEMQRSMNRVLSNNQKIAAATFQSSWQLTEISHESTMAMQQVAGSVQGVSEGTTAQKRTTAETATTMNEMSIGVLRIAEAASEVAIVAMRANEHAELGNQQLVETVNQMANIKKTQVESSQIVAKLDEHSARISQIIKAIMDVAKQTKLLALNANIEAAREGEHGRGFGVVAREVGKLAEETSRSGESISDLLNVIRSLVGDTVSAMDSMQTETNVGMESIERSKVAIKGILSDIKLVSEQIQEVSATSEEMSAEMEEITASIAEISDISHKTSNEAETMAAAAEEQLASMEQIQSSAEELKDMSQQLQDDLSKFVLQDLTV